MHRMELDSLIKQGLQAVKNHAGDQVEVEFDLCVGADETEKKLMVYPTFGQSTEVSRIRFIIET